MDKLLDALRETLAKLGLDESAIDAALQEAIAKAEGSEENPVEGDPAPAPTEGDVPPTDIPPSDVPTEGEGDVAPSDEPNPADVVPPEGDVPPVDVPVEPEPAPAPIPPFDPAPLLEQITALQGALDEEKKANEGLSARVQALEEALKKAGVIDGSSPIAEVGDGMPGAAPTNPTEDVFSNVLAEINGKKTF